MHRPKHPHRLLDHSSACFLLRHVGLDDFRYAVLIVDHPFGLQDPIEIAIHQSHLGPVPGEKNGGCPSVANLTWSRLLYVS